jgi:hypothetical protein
VQIAAKGDILEQGVALVLSRDFTSAYHLIFAVNSDVSNLNFKS